MTNQERAPKWLDRKVKRLDLVDQELQNGSLAGCVDSHNILDLAGFRPSQLAEESKQLSQAVWEAYQKTDWASVSAVRNIVLREYHRIDWKAAFVTASVESRPLRALCVKKLAQLKS